MGISAPPDNEAPAESEPKTVGFAKLGQKASEQLSLARYADWFPGVGWVQSSRDQLRTKSGQSQSRERPPVTRPFLAPQLLISQEHT